MTYLKIYLYLTVKILTINDVSWEQLDTFALRKSFSEPQEVIAEWTVESVKASSFKVVNEGSKLSTESKV